MKTRRYPCLLLFSALLSIPYLGAQTVTIDAYRLADVTTLDAPFRFHIGDDPDFANANFDDSAWQLLKPGESLPSAHLPDLQPDTTWSRIHLHIANPMGPLGIAITISDGLPYEVFANGRQIAISPSMHAKAPQYIRPFAIELPQSSDIVLSVRCLVTAHTTSQLFPLARFQIGQLGAIRSATELERIRSFNNSTLVSFLLGLIYLAFSAVALSLFLSQRNHLEYLWLAIFCLFSVAYHGAFTAINVGAISATLLHVMFSVCAGWATLLSSLEFVLCFSRAEHVRPARFVQLVMLFCPLLALAQFERAYGIALISTFLVLLFLMSFYLVQAIRRGRAESWLLLPSFAIWAFNGLLSMAAIFYPSSVPLLSGIHFGYVGISFEDIGGFVVAFGFLVVVLFRFIRVSSAEQRSAAEIAAARTVQQILIPETIPAITGLTIESAYLPADEVGGDFFQILPQPSGTTLIFLGDVSGHGLKAAMTVSLLVGSIRTLTDFLQSPAQLLTRLNQRLVGHSSGFATCLILAISPDGLLTYANAGHLNPYLDGHELESEPNLPLGLAPDVTYTESTMHLNSSQRLTLLTDGVLEATNSKTNALFGFDRTREVSTQSAQSIAATAKAFAFGAPQADDITVLTIQLVAT
ncbi:PP2C family protein-serine/threonine phosphatase [Edaphobacter modestus]|uniref:Stage II sporulation protein E n=1 Tax=Edaphobacter modestus TaxID=388466 RepID=A0A4Q7YRQ0_9BACT|nr:SpoIIE family protein phosphatase [Edaphobacter modestus]RZU40387.1 stage II sporulation protein E [Edaphobacter modestus]